MRKEKRRSDEANLRISNAGLATLVSTSATLLVTVREEIVARLAGPADAASGLPEDSFLTFDRRFDITRISIRILFQFGSAKASLAGSQ